MGVGVVAELLSACREPGRAGSFTGHLGVPGALWWSWQGAGAQVAAAKLPSAPSL